MFSALRRCPAALSKSISPAILSSRTSRVPLSAAALRLTTPRVPIIATQAFHQSAKWREAVAVADAATQEHEANDGPVTEFKDLASRGLVHPNIVNTITRNMRLTTMTDVQSRTISEALSGVDVIAQAKTGTGKTLGFLIPTIQRIIQKDPQLAERTRGHKRATADDIRAIIISPTRELAEQIAVEAKKLTQGTGLIVQAAVGGTMKRVMLQKTQREGCHILIGTPGRLNDVLSDPYSGVKAPNLAALVMDEADRLLDQGFQQEIEQIKEHLPDSEERQNLMFSATIPREVVDLVRRTMRPGFHFAKCVDEDAEPTHANVLQKLVHVQGFENIMPTLFELIQRQYRNQENNDRPFKAILYFNSTSEVTLAASVFYKLSGGPRQDKPLSGLRTFEIHSKLSQAARTRAADNFRSAKSGVLFSSDVTARGMDFPDVTHVIQIGLPRDRESYIHRLGRTGRAGKEGEGWLIVTPYDQAETGRRLRGMPLKLDESLASAQVDMSEPAELPEDVAYTIEQTVNAHKSVYPDQLDAAFRGLFGSFQGYEDKQGLLDGANRLAEFGWGMPTPPQPPSSFFSEGKGRRDGSGRSGGNRQGGGGGFGGFRGDRRGGGFGGDRRGGGFDGDRRGGSFGGDRRGGSFGGDRRGGSFGGDRRGGSFGGDRRGGSFGGDRRGGSFGGDRRGGGSFGRGGGGGRRESRF